MYDIKKAINKYEKLIEEFMEENQCIHQSQLDLWELVLEALREKQERDSVKQWIDDMNNPLELLKVESALSSEVMKMNYRKEHKPKNINVLDYTIIAVLVKELGIKEEYYEKYIQSRII